MSLVTFLMSTIVCKLFSVVIILCIFYSELQVASFDNKMAHSVAKNVSKTIKMFAVKCEQLVSEFYCHFFHFIDLILTL